MKKPNVGDIIIIKPKEFNDKLVVEVTGFDGEQIIGKTSYGWIIYFSVKEIF